MDNFGTNRNTSNYENHYFFLKGTPQNTQRRVKRGGSNRQARLISNFDQYGMSVGK